MKSWNEIKKFSAIVRLSHPYIIWIWVINGVSTAVIPFISLYYSAEILNLLIMEAYERAFHSVILMCLLIFVFSIISKIFHNRLQVIRRTATQGLDQKLLKKAMVLAYERLECQDTLDTLRRTRNSMNGSGTIGDTIHRMALCIVSLFKIILAIIAFVCLLIQIHTWDMYLLFLMIAMIVILAVKNISAKQHGKLLKELCDRNDHFNAISNYILQLFYDMKMAKEIRLYAMEHLFEHKINDILKESGYREYGHKNGKLYFYDHIIAQLLSFCSYLYVASLALRSIISIGQVLYISGIILNAVNAIAEFQFDYAQIRHQISYLNSFYDFLNTQDMRYDGTLPIEKRDDGAYLFEFRNVSFRYPGQTAYVLKNVSMVFHLKEKVAIVGMNGAGKTTLVKLLCRLYEPEEGEILLNGITISKYDYAQYTSIFSVVFQDFKLFSYELDQNVTCAKQGDHVKLIQIFRTLGIQERIESFKDKEHSLLFKDNGNGVNVSGGEAQKIAIARALYKDAPFVILDEPTAALDPISEADIYEHFDYLVNDKTTLYISHRMSSCKFCDRIIVLHQGQIEEEGTHEELLKHEGIYARLWNAQAKYYETDKRTKFQKADL